MSHFIASINLQGDRSANWDACKDNGLLGIPDAVALEARRAVVSNDVIYIWKAGGLRHNGGLLARAEAVGPAAPMRGTEPWVDNDRYGCTIPIRVTHEFTQPVFDPFPANAANRLGIENGWVTRSWAAISDARTIRSIEQEFERSTPAG
ncbi:hypothetical protein ACI796_02455 [Geodermatophilus sp. SYSU D00525]